MGMIPAREVLPMVGFKPTTPARRAGPVMEPDKVFDISVRSGAACMLLSPHLQSPFRAQKLPCSQRLLELIPQMSPKDEP